jgi:hypothetical protein
LAYKLLLQYQTIQALWPEVADIRPVERARLRSQEDLFKLIGNKKLLKHWSCQLCRHGNFSMGLIVKLEGEGMPRNELLRCDLKQDGLQKKSCSSGPIVLFQQ